MIFFKCNHPFHALIVDKKASIERADDDFDTHTLYFQCDICGQKLTKHYAVIRTPEKFFSFKEDKK